MRLFPAKLHITHSSTGFAVARGTLRFTPGTAARGASFFAAALALSVGAGAAEAPLAPETRETRPARDENVTAPVVKLDPILVVAQSIAYVAPSSIASKLELPVREIPQSVSVITQQRILDQGLVSVADALDQVTGVTVIRNNPTASQFRSRGYTLGVANDGVPAYNAGFDPFPDLFLYEQLEVLRGPAGLLQGVPSGTDLGGTLNLVKKRAKREPSAAFEAHAGSWEDYGARFDVNAPVLASSLNGDLRLRLVGYLGDRDFFYDKSHQATQGLFGTLAWDVTKTTLVTFSAQLALEQNDVLFGGVPSATLGGVRQFAPLPREANIGADWGRSDSQIGELALSVEQKIGENWTVKVRGAYIDQFFANHDGSVWGNGAITEDTDPDSVSGLKANFYRREYHYDITRAALDAYATGKFQILGREHSLVVGGNFESFRYKYKDYYADNVAGVDLGRIRELVPDFVAPAIDESSRDEVNNGGLYTQLRASLLDSLKAIAGLRLSFFESKSSYDFGATWEDGGKATAEPTPYGGIVWDASKHFTFYASYSELFIPQTALSVHGGVIDPRTGWQSEVGVKSQFFDNRLNITAAFFYLQDEGRPYLVQSTPSLYDNLGKVENYGVDFEITGSPYPGWELTVGYTYLHSRLKTGYSATDASVGLPLNALDPDHTFKFWGIKRFGDGPLKGLSLGAGLRWVSGNGGWLTGTNSRLRQNSYSVADLFVSYRFNEHLSLRVNANNIFDTSYFIRFNGGGKFLRHASKHRRNTPLRLLNHKTATPRTHNIMAKTTVKIIGLKCPGCSGRVKRTIAALPGVNNADVVLETGLLTVDYDEAQREAASLAEEVRALGFKVADDPVAAG